MLFYSFSSTIQEFCLFKSWFTDGLWEGEILEIIREAKLFRSIHLSKSLDSVCVCVCMQKRWYFVLLFNPSLPSWRIYILTIPWVILIFLGNWICVPPWCPHIFLCLFFPYPILQKPSFIKSVEPLSAMVWNCCVHSLYV